MTNSTTNIPILDDDATNLIEARSKTGHYPSLETVAALCQTVRALRAKHEWLRSKIAWHRDGVGPDVPVLQERYDKLIAQRNDLRSQLGQLTKERDRFSELADKRHDDLCEARRQRDSLAARHVEYTRDAMTAAIDDFRVHAVRLCRDKADEYDKHPEAAHALRAVAGKLEQLK